MGPSRVCSFFFFDRFSSHAFSFPKAAKREDRNDLPLSESRGNVLSHRCISWAWLKGTRILFSLNSIFVYLDLFPSDNIALHIPISLATVIKRLGLEDRFHTYPICAQCHTICDRSIPISACCPRCRKALFNPASCSLFKCVTGQAPPLPPPNCAAPLRTLSSLLHNFFLQDGIEDVVEMWKHREADPCFLTDIMDGYIWNNLKDKDGKKFFDANLETSEIRLGVTLSLDW